MFNDLILVHRRGADSIRTVSSEWLLWQTCLRKIAFGPADAIEAVDLRAEDEILRGEDAYRFCLEVVCGLHSPLVGETEVFGQFKNATDAWELGSSPFAADMRRLIRAVFEDAKKIRSAHLGDLGSQSYGSLLRKELRLMPEIHVIGGGHLVGEILPWICKDGTRVHVHVRNVARAEELRAKYPMIQLHALTDAPERPMTGALIVAAPVAASWLEAWSAAGRARFARIFDLRGEWATDSIPSSLATGAVTGLAEMMRRISANQEMVEQRRLGALEMIQKTVHTRALAIEYRPFGWEDVCA